MKRPSETAISESDLRQRIVQLEQIVEQQTARIAELEQELARRKGRSRRGAASSESDASSSPRTGASKRRSSGRSPGGHPGHEGHGRSWVSVEQVDQRVPVKPSTCQRCGYRLRGHDPHPYRHQEIVLPPLRAEVIEYQLHTLRCRRCDRLTEAGWPEGVSRHTFGPSVQAWVGLLAGAYRMSKRNIQALLFDAFGLEVSLGTVSRLEQEVAGALAGPVEEARAFEEFVARGGEAACIGQQLLDASEQLFTWWHRVRDGTLQRSSFQVYVSDLRWRFHNYLRYGQQFADAKTAATCANLLDLGPALWTFVRTQGVEPTKQRSRTSPSPWGVVASHQLRHPQCRWQPLRRALLTVRDTLRQQQRNVLDYLRMACDAAVSQQQAPSLLPSNRATIR